MIGTLLSQNSGVLSKPRSRFTVFFNQKAFHTGLNIHFVKKLTNYDNNYIITFFDSRKNLSMSISDRLRGVTSIVELIQML